MNNQKAFVVTSAQIMGPEVYEGLFGSYKSAEKYIRKLFPNARKDEPVGNKTSFLCRNKFGESLMFIVEDEIQ